MTRSTAGIGIRSLNSIQTCSFKIPHSPPNYSTPIFLTPRNILSHTQILHFRPLKQHILINETLNMYLNNITFCLTW